MLISWVQNILLSITSFLPSSDNLIHGRTCRWYRFFWRCLSGIYISFGSVSFNVKGLISFVSLLYEIVKLLTLLIHNGLNILQAKCVETGESVAIKKVLQDKRYKNRELQVMRMLEHTNVLKLKHCFYSTAEKDEVYLNLVLEFVPETVYRVSKHYVRMHQHMPIIYVQLYTYQVI